MYIDDNMRSCHNIYIYCCRHRTVDTLLYVVVLVHSLFSTSDKIKKPNTLRSINICILQNISILEYATHNEWLDASETKTHENNRYMHHCWNVNLEKGLKHGIVTKTTISYIPYMIHKIRNICALSYKKKKQIVQRQ